MELKSRVFFADEKLKEEFESLENGKYEDKEIFIHLKRAFGDLKINAHSGIQIPKKLIPKPYIEKYNITNLWKYDLPKGWRPLYSVGTDGIEIISIILEWMDHKEYERMFNY